VEGQRGEKGQGWGRGKGEKRGVGGKRRNGSGPDQVLEKIDAPGFPAQLNSTPSIAYDF